MAEMLINGHDIAGYGARLLTYDIGGTTITNYTANTGHIHSLPMLLGRDLAPRKLTITLTFASSGTVLDRLQQVAVRKCNFDREVTRTDPCIIQLPNGYYYRCRIVTIGSLPGDSSGLVDVAYTFDAIQQLSEVEFSMTQGTSYLLCTSTTDIHCVVELTHVSGTVGKITCDALGITANIPIGKTLIIDGYEKTITIDGANAFANLTEFMSFPVLHPGTNALSLFGNSGTAYSLSMLIRYYPIIV